MGRGFHIPERSVLHFNVADFAVAVERVKDTSLRQKPVIIAPLQAARAVVYDMSEEAFSDGVRKGMVLKQARRLCRGAVVLSPRPPLYQRAMEAFFREVRHYSPLIEYGQGDGHFFVDVTGTHRLHGPAPDVGWRIRREVVQGLGINPIWALGSSKLISKVASRLVKPVGEYIVSPGDEANFLGPLPVELLPGLSGRELEKLLDFQLLTIGAVARLDLRQLQVPFGSRAAFLHAASRGVDDSRVNLPGSGSDAIVLEHDFAEDTNDREEVRAVLARFAGRAGDGLRGCRLVTRRLGVWLHYSDGGHVVRQASRRTGASGEFLLQKMMETALERVWIRRTRIRSCRLVCDRLRRESPQLLLFPETKDREKKEIRMVAAMDQVRSRYGSPSIGVGRCYRAPVAAAAGCQ